MQWSGGTLFQCFTIGGTAVSQPAETRQTEATANHDFHMLQQFWEDETLFNVQDLEAFKHSLSETLPTQCLFSFFRRRSDIRRGLLPHLACTEVPLSQSDSETADRAQLPGRTQGMHGVFISPFLSCCSCLCWCSFLSSVVRSSPRRNVAASGSVFSFSILTMCYCSC